MSNPRIAQGTINKIRGSVIINNYTGLTVTAPFLGRGMISLSFSGDASSLILTATGGVQSPEPYVVATITMDLLKTTGTYQAWRNQFESSTNIGEVRVVPDTTAVSDYTISNCTIVSIGDLPLDGTAVETRVTMQGFYYINNSIWNL